MKGIKPALLCLAALMFSCGSSLPAKEELINVVLEKDETFQAVTMHTSVKKGESAFFYISLSSGTVISEVSYPNYGVSKLKDYYLLELKDIRYPMVVKIGVSLQAIALHGEEETASVPKNLSHMRENAPGYKYAIAKQGYAQTGWEDDSGNFYGFGWRMPSSINDLYPHYEKEAAEESFGYSIREGGAVIESAQSAGADLVIPSSIGGAPVREIASGAIHDDCVERLILPVTLASIEAGSIVSSSLKEITMYDDLGSVSDDSFSCPNLKTVNLLAVQDPAYSGTYWDVFQDKVDYLHSIKDDKKIVLFGGSSVRYGYCSPDIMENFPDYKVVNMGVYAYMNSSQQFEVVQTYLKEGDVIIFAPEFDAVEHQFFTSDEVDHHFFNCLESGYQEAALLDLTKNESFFDAYAQFHEVRSKLPRSSYKNAAKYYDDDMNAYSSDTYNVYGDMVFPRAGNAFEGRISQVECDYLPSIISQSTFDSCNAHWDEIEAMGVKVLFNYAPKNIHCLTEASTLEERNKLEALINEKLDLPIMGELEESLYQAKYFYLIDNHLTNDGARIHTEKLIANLKPLIA
ncbi:MAG: hypothetical protein K6F32_05580 [Bacilli bacterium]|nr:hypothetical protein [Bacilli bacterium]